MRKIQCPICKKPVLWSQDFPFRPFCSERCRIIDLGGWADESYAIPVQDKNQLEENNIDDLEEDDEG